MARPPSSADSSRRRAGETDPPDSGARPTCRSSAPRSQQGDAPRPQGARDLPHAPARPLTMLDFLQNFRGRPQPASRSGRGGDATRTFDAMLRAAVAEGASDVHCEPKEGRAARALPARRRNARATGGCRCAARCVARARKDFRRNGHHRETAAAGRPSRAARKAAGGFICA
jgi:hypothetical protein